MTVGKKCALCSNILSSANQSKEHIIPNAIGGRKKTGGFVCIDCNNRCGQTWDAELAKQLNWFCLAVGVRRERGSVPKQIVQTVGGDRYWLLSDGSLHPESSHSTELLGDQVTIKMTAKTLEEARQRLKGVVRKYPKFDVAKALEEAEIKTTYLDSPILISHSWGGPDAGRSVVKTALAFASECGVSPAQCEKARECLQPDSKAMPFGFFYLSDLVQSRPESEIFHCVSLHGDPKKKRLWSYIEYFGLCRVVVLLSDVYVGPHRYETYALNPRNGEPIAVKVATEIPDEQFSLAIQGDGFDQEIYEAAMNYAFPIIIDISWRRARGNVVREGVQHAVRKLGIKVGQDIPRERAAEFSSLMMEKISPFIDHLFGISKRDHS